MESGGQEKKAVSSNTPEAASEQHSLEALDAAKINTLLETAQNRLTTDIYGNFNLQGDRLAKNSRLIQLREVVELNQVLQDVKTLIERKNVPAVTEASSEARKMSKPNGTQAELPRDMIKKELSISLLDIEIENERMKESLLKAEERAKKADADLAAVQENMRRLNSGQLKGLRSAVKEEVGRCVRDTFEQMKAKQRLADSEKNVQQASMETETQMRALEATLIQRVSNSAARVQRHVDVQISDAKELSSMEIEKLRQDHDNDIDKLSSELLQWRTEHNEKLHSCNLWGDDVPDSDSDANGGVNDVAEEHFATSGCDIQSDGEEAFEAARFGKWKLG